LGYFGFGDFCFGHFGLSHFGFGHFAFDHFVMANLGLAILVLTISKFAILVLAILVIAIWVLASFVLAILGFSFGIVISFGFHFECFFNLDLKPHAIARNETSSGLPLISLQIGKLNLVSVLLFCSFGIFLGGFWDSVFGFCF